MSEDLRKRVASVIMRHCPHGGRLGTALSSADITETLQREGMTLEQIQVDKMLLELAAVGFLWLSISDGPRHGHGQDHGQRIVVASVMYPYGLQLIA